LTFDEKENFPRTKGLSVRGFLEGKSICIPDLLNKVRWEIGLTIVRDVRERQRRLEDGELTGKFCEVRYFVGGISGGLKIDLPLDFTRLT
jgi:hypothetical protein